VPPADCFARRATVVHRPTNRTLAYADLAEAAAKQPVPQSVTLKDPKDFQIIGKPLPRLDTPAKVNGSAQFGIDVRVPGMKYASVAACPTLGGKLAGVDDTAARKVRGVLDVLKIDNAVAVTAENWWAANQGLKALRITWDPGPNATLSSKDLVDHLRSAAGTGSPIIARQQGDVDGALRGAAKRVEAAYELPFLAHATMEPINTVVHVRPDACEVWVGTQVPVSAQHQAALATGLPQDKVIVHNQYLGGGFGRRLVAESVGQAARFARQVSYPLKVIWTREEDIQHDLYRPAYYDKVSCGLDANGAPVVWTDQVTGASVLAHYVPQGLAPGKLDPDAVEGAAQPPYDFATIRVGWVRTDPPIPVTWWRGVGPTHNVFVVESFMDEVAHAAGKDPVAFRLSVLKHNPRAAAVLERAAELSDWGKPLPKGIGRGVALHDSFGSYVAAVVETEVAPTGEIRMRRVTGVIDCGLVINPDSVKAQLEGGLIFGLTAALYNDITFEHGRVQQSNFNNYRMMRINETPPFRIEVMQNTDGPGGVGETGTVAAAPALGNAIFAATGVRLRRYPFNRDALRSKGIDHSSVASLTPGGPGAASAGPQPQDAPA
jgi:isoquinoline 1-oxidoreductase beta subunit